MTFSDVGETSPGYGHVIDHTRRARGYARDYRTISIAMAVQTEKATPYLPC